MTTQKKASPRKAGHQKDAKAPAAGDSSTLSVEDAKFLQKVATHLDGVAPERNVLINIPIWGWTGDGKTCSLITAIHFCDPAVHPLGLSLISNFDELASLESGTEEYRGLNLVSNASATTERLRTLSELFIDRNEWPPGTDEPSSYLLAVRSIDRTLGYALLPDLKGGSFRELDPAAREVLRAAHAAVLLVNPELYDKKTTDGKRYRDEILARLQHFGATGVPVCVMITKADLHQGQNQATDNTHNQLTIIVDRQKSLTALVCRVSVIGLNKDLQENRPPPASDRNPENLIKAWIWIIAQALVRPPELIRKTLPSLDIRSVSEGAVPVAAETIPEVRQAGDFSDSPGAVLCACADDPRQQTFAFIGDDGQLYETTISSNVSEEPQFRTVGQIHDWDDGLGELSAHYLGGEFFVGAATECNFIWQGAKGASLTKVSLPLELVSWSPLGARRLIGLDNTGRLHSLRLEGGKWVQSDYVEGFISPSGIMRCGFVDHAAQVIALNGTSTEAIAMGPDGRFGARVATGVVCKFDSAASKINRHGLCAAALKTGEVVVGAPEKQLTVGMSKAGADPAFAVAEERSLVAMVGPDLRLSAALIRDGNVRRSAPEYSPLIQALPNAMAWGKGGESLVTTFEDGTWAVFRPLGLAAR